MSQRCGFRRGRDAAAQAEGPTPLPRFGDATRMMPERKIRASRPTKPGAGTGPVYLEEDAEAEPNKKQFIARALLLSCLMFVAIGAAYDIGGKVVSSPKVLCGALETDNFPYDSELTSSMLSGCSSKPGDNAPETE